MAYLRYEAGDALAVILRNVALEKLLLYKAVQALVREVDAKLVERVRARCQVLRARQIEQANERDKVVLAKALVDMLVQPREQE
jgi:hypothetical protein